MRAKIVAAVIEATPKGFAFKVKADRGPQVIVRFPVTDLIPRCDNFAQTDTAAYCICGSWLWVFNKKIVSVTGDDAATEEERAIEVMHAVAKRDRKYDRLRHAMRSYKNVERLEDARRESIPEDVRMFVWQRDAGVCVKCGGNTRLEFDHIIPVCKGGSNTARNIRLLCERCNREKGSEI